MDIGVVAKRYAKALLNFACEEGTEDTVYEETRQVIRSFRDVPQVSAVLSSPMLPAGQKAEVLCRAASTDASPTFRRFAQLVVERRRESFMLFIAHSYITLYRQLKHISIGHLITATPVSEAVAGRLERMVEREAGGAVDVILDKTVDPSILGGFIFQIDDLRLDASVKAQFDKIKKQFIEQNKRII